METKCGHLASRHRRRRRHGYRSIGGRPLQRQRGARRGTEKFRKYSERVGFRQSTLKGSVSGQVRRTLGELFQSGRSRTAGCQSAERGRVQPVDAKL